MKKTITTLLMLCIGLVSFAQTFCLKLSEVTNDGSNYVVKIEMQGSVPFQLGSGNLQFGFPESALGIPSVASTTLAPPFYFDPSITIPLPGQASFNMELVFPGSGMELATAPDWTELAQISFPIVDAGALAPLAWSYNGGTTQTVVFADDEATQLFVSDPCCLMFESLTSNGNSAVRLTSVDPETNTVSMKNFGDMDVDVSGWRLCSNFSYANDGLEFDDEVSLVSGDFLLQPNEELTVTWVPGNGAFRVTGDDMGIYMPTGGFNSTEAMIDYMQYIIVGARQNVAVEKGIWTAGEVVTGDPAFSFSGTIGDFGASFWSGFVPAVPCAELMISEYGEPNGGNAKYIEIYNPTDDLVDLATYEIWKISNGGDWPEQTLALSGTIGSGGTFVIGNNDIDVPAADQISSGVINFNGDDAMGLAKNGVLIDAVGTDGPDPGSGFNVAGVSNGTQNKTLIRKNTVLAPNTNWAVSAGADEASSEWVVVDFSQANLGLHSTECVTGVIDSDQDGVADADDNCPNDPNPNQENMDGDLLGDACDGDIDGDGFDNENDCDPMDNAVFEGATCDDGDVNTENDVILPDCSCLGTLITIDTDEDGVFDVDDNCPDTPNPNQEDMDGDLVGDVCDDDIDGDEVLNVDDCAPMDAAVFQGATCDDGNPESLGDIILADCSCAGVIPAGDCDAMMISEYGEPDGGNGKYIELYNASNAEIDLTGYAIWKVSNGGTWPEQTLDLSGIVAAGGTFVIANNDTEVPGADIYDSGIINFNGDDAMALAVNGQLLDVIGTDGLDPGTGFDVAGVANATANNTIIRKSSVLAPTSDWTISAGTDEVNSQWIVVDYSQDNLGLHTSDCVDPGVSGCTDIEACNYNELATIDDGTCLLATGCDACDGNGGVVDNPEIGDACDDGDETTENDVLVNCNTCVGTVIVIDGCTNDSACNYNENANNDDGTCLFATGCDVCDGNGGVIDNPEVGDSCDDGDATTIDDVYTSCDVCAGVTVPGCTDDEACNFDAEATIDDESCVFATGCDICFEGVVVDMPEIGDVCDDGNNETINDVIVACGVCAGVIPGVDGCTDNTACNFNSSATDEDGSCVFATGCDTCSGETDGTGVVVDNPEVGDSCDDGDETTIDDVIIDCGFCMGETFDIFGCADDAACNYDEAVTVDDGSCVYATGCDVCDENGGVINNPEVGDSCDDGDPLTDNDVYVSCDLCLGQGGDIPGCTDNEACNYDETATLDDGSCNLANGCDECDGNGGVLDNPEIGDACDDGNENTFDDTIVDCGICAGQLCDVEVAIFEATSPTVFCTDDNIDDTFTFNVIGGSGENALLFATELDGTVLAALDIEPINFNLANDGEFLIYHMFYDGSPLLVGGNNIADFEGCFLLSDPIAVSVISGDDCPAVFDCPELMANIGDECDDGNDDLIPGIVSENCECIPGEVDCPELGLNIGDACDDGNPLTTNDAVTANCVCEGTEISDCTVVQPSIWGMGPWYQVTNGTFIAESANDAILATGDGELIIEVFDGECGGTSLGLYNTVNAGDIERVVVGDLVAGNTYSYVVHDGVNIQSKVKTYADSRLEDFDCNVNQNLIDQIYALREETMYANPAVQVTGFAFRFEDEVTGEVTELVDANVDGFYQQLSTIPGLEAGHSYVVTVRHRVLQIANGVVATLWSDYGSECTVTINDSEGDFASPVSSLTLSKEEVSALIYPNPNTGDNVYVHLKNLMLTDAKMTIEILDLYGKKVFSEQYTISSNEMTQELMINEDLASGIYLVNIVTNGQSVVKKMNVQ